MRSLNLDQLRALQAVIDERSFSAAARRLNLSQPAISVQIRELELRFGVKLIERFGKQAHPTPPGQDLLDASLRIFEECESAEQSMRRYREGWIGRVRIGTTNTAFSHLLPPVLRQLSHEHPGIDLQVTNLPTSESVEGILQNRIDLALVSLPVESSQIKITPLLSEQMVAIFPKSARDVPRTVTPAYVMGQPLLMEHVRAATHAHVRGWLSRESGQPRVPMQLGSVEALKSAVASALGMSIIPQIAITPADKDIISRPLEPSLMRTIALAEHRSKPSAPALDIARSAILTLAATEKINLAGRRSHLLPLATGTRRRKPVKSRRTS